MDKKVNFRRESVHQLKHISGVQKYYKDKKSVAQIYAYIKSHNIQSILLYIPLSLEVNIYPLILKLRKEKKHIYVPYMEKKSFKAIRYRLPLYKKKFSIKEPNNSYMYRKRKIDLAIVPIIGIDATCRRIGFGKGMYDRFFEKESSHIGTIMFISRTLSYSREEITNNYDIRADIIITG